MRNLFSSFIRDDSGLILRGNAAVIFLVVIGVIALISGPAGWITFAGILTVSAVLTGLNMLFSSIRQSRNRP